MPSSTKKVKPDIDSSTAPESANNGAPAAAETRKCEMGTAHITSRGDSNKEAIIVPNRRKMVPNRRNKIQIHSVNSDSDTQNKDGPIEEPGLSGLSSMSLRDSFQYKPILSHSSPSILDKTMNRKSIEASGSTMVLPESSEPHEKELADGDGDWMHCKLEWMKPENIMDRQRRKRGDLDYDPSTLYVPLEFLNSQTPAHRLWWELKSLHYDCVLFLKVGTSYELYHMDASVGVTELGFNYMKSDFAHSEFPEVAYGRTATTLISKGYKVARVEQTKTPETMEERCETMDGMSTKSEKVVLREICAVIMRDSLMCDLQESGPCEASAIFMMPITEEVEEVEATWAGGRTMVLDFITLRNLRIPNEKGSLYDRLNSCVTPMGKRLLHQWVCAPSCSLTAIQERQAAVAVLLGDLELCRSARAILATLPDFEEVLPKLHALGKQHPDARAISHVDKIYSERNVSDFMSMLKGFTDVLTLGQLFTSTDSVLLRRLTQIPPVGTFPDYRSTLQFFQDEFNQEEARDEGRILPKEGVDEVYDAALCELEEIQADADEYLNQQERYFRCKLRFVGVGKRRFQLEIPNKLVHKIGPEYILEGRTGKTTMRYTTEETKDILARLIAAEERKANSLNDVNRRVFHKFTAHCADWEAAVQCCAALDVLVALADFARMQTDSICLPEITDNNHQKPYISISNGRHPCTSVPDNFVSNDTSMGADEATLMLLTGPTIDENSTLMRHVALLTVLAHLGSYVPAGKCSLSLVDRIFTRLGASADIHTWQSTFPVEMKDIVNEIKARMETEPNENE